MKKIIKTIITAIILTGAVACEKEAKLQLADLKVELSFAEEFKTESTEGVKVVISNVVDNVTKEITADATGIVIFKGITSGIYNVSASKEKTVSLVLNGTANDIAVAANSTAEVKLVLNGKPSADDFVIKEIYTCGSKVPGVLFKDQFIEIYNNTDKTLYADGIVVAVLTGEAGQTVPGKPINLPLDKYTYSENVAKVAGSGKDYPVEPGKSFIITMNAIDFSANFTEGSTIDKNFYPDLSGADMEFSCHEFLKEQGLSPNTFFDVNNADVPDVEIVYLSNVVNMAMFNIDSNGSSIAIFRDGENFNRNDLVESPYNTGDNKKMYLRIPNEIIIDGVDVLSNSAAGSFKRLNYMIDAGFTYLKADGKANYSGMSSRRKMGANGKLVDTNNSANDFKAIPFPTPRIFK